MILRRPLLTSLSSLVVVLTSALTTHAETESPQPPRTDYRASPAEPVEAVTPHQATSISEPEHTAATGNSSTAVSSEHSEKETGAAIKTETPSPTLQKAAESEETKALAADRRAEEAHREIIGL